MNNINGIVCVDTNGYYANKDGGPLPWPHSEGDLDWFKYITKGHIILVGSKTYEELQKLPPLKDREIWPFGSKHDLKTVDDVLTKFEREESRDLFIGGGAYLWRAFLPYYDHFYATILNKEWIIDGMKLCPRHVQEGIKHPQPFIEKDKYSVYDFKLQNILI